jgi:excisionase family DNA binding protein
MPADFRIDELIDLLAERLAKRVETRLNDADSTLRPRLLPVDRAADYLGRTEDSIRHLIASGRLPVVRSDKRVFLDRQDLDNWIEDHKQ